MSTSQEYDLVDVLIIGAGPAGLIAAKWLSQYGIKTLIVDKRLPQTRVGQADGIQARTLELLDSFGLAGIVLSEARLMGEFCMWNPIPGADDLIQRTSRMPNTIPGLSHFRQGVILSQQRLEEILLESLSQSPNTEFQRLMSPFKLEFDAEQAENESSYPITVSFHAVDDATEKPLTPPQDPSDKSFETNCSMSNGIENTNPQCEMDQNHDSTSQVTLEIARKVKSKYMIGCDGAHSWTRRQLGFKMEGEQTDSFWGVLDIVPITNFPDIRCRCAIRSSRSGNIMLIPREGKLVRIYCQLNDEFKKHAKTNDRSKAAFDLIFNTCQKIMKPYTLTYKHCDWWSIYQIGQRVGNRFDFSNRIFLAGDAVHTHSPKAGQGMNVSMQDSYNLGWKLALVLKGFAHRGLLTTYGHERRSIALSLIEFDRHFSKLFSSRLTPSSDDATTSAFDFETAFSDQKIFSAGFAVDYQRSILTVKNTTGIPTSAETSSIQSKLLNSKQHLATGVPAGKRFPSFKVLNHSDSQPWHLAKWLRGDGKFRIILFAGDVSQPEQMNRVRLFCDYLSRPESILHRPISNALTVQSYVEFLTLHSAPRKAIELSDFPKILHPFDEDMGWDYDKIFVDAESYYEGHGEAYNGYGISKKTGCVVIVRPDQYTGWIGDLEDVNLIEEYFARLIMSD